MKKIFAVKVISWMVMNMTTDEAIIEIQTAIGLRNAFAEMYGKDTREHLNEALDLAIEALKQQKTMPTIEQSMMKEFRLEVENSDLRRQIEILKKQLDKYKENNQ